MAISKEQQDWFSTIIENIQGGAPVCLMEVREKATGKKVAMICAARQTPNPEVQAFMPLAMMVDQATAVDEYDPPLLNTDDEFENTQ